MSSDKQIMDCPICMEDIECTKNCITTECGHCFHASCLMKSVAHNGFGCPYCRSAMAEDIKAEEDEDEWESVESFEDDEYALRGLRFFMNNVEGVEHDQYDMEDEDIDDEEDRESSVEVEEVPKPTAGYLTEKLLEQGITMEQMVKAMLLRHDEYEAEEEAYNRVDGQIFGKIRCIIENYNRRPRQVISVPPLDINVVTEFPPPVQQEESLVESLDDSAQPKVPRPQSYFRRSIVITIDETIAN